LILGRAVSVTCDRPARLFLHTTGHSLIFSEGTETSGSSRNGSLPIYGKFKVPFPFFFWLNLVSCLFIFQNGTNYVCLTFPSRLPNFDLLGGGGKSTNFFIGF
jgi:hypothetical protein